MKKHKNVIQIILGTIFGLTLLYIVLKDFEFIKLEESLRKSNLFYIVLTGILLWFVYYLRAMRWGILLKNANISVKRKNLIYAVMLGYFVNSLTPKLGEIVRCKILYDREKIPISQSIATVVAERLYDVVVLFLGVSIVFVLHLDVLEGILSQITENSVFFIIVLIVGCIVGILLLYMLLLLKKRITNGFLKKIIDFLFEILSTLKDSVKIKQYWIFLLYTGLIWTTLIFMNYVCMLALPDTNMLPISFTVVILFVTGIGWAMPVPNGIGFTHYIVTALFIAFSYTETAGIIFGFVSNSLTLLYTLLIGGTYFLISLSKNKLFEDNK